MPRLAAKILPGCALLLLLCGLAPRPARADGAASAPTAPTVTLLSAGKGPKAVLRYGAKPGAVEHMTMTMKMGMAITVGGQAMPAQSIPPITAAMQLKVASISSAGDIRYDFVYEGFSVARDKADKTVKPEMIAALEGPLANLKGLKGYVVITPRGFTKEALIDVPATTGPQERQILQSMQQSTEQLASPLPAEAVGVGGTWEVKTPLRMNGIALDQVTKVELLQRKGARHKLRIALTQNAAAQKISANGITANLKSLAGEGSGTSQLDLSKLIPVQAKMAMHSTMEMEAMGQTMAMDIQMEMQVQGK